MDGSLPDCKRSMGDLPGRAAGSACKSGLRDQIGCKSGADGPVNAKPIEEQRAKDRCDFDVVARLKEGEEGTLKNGINLVGRFAPDTTGAAAGD